MRLTELAPRFLGAGGYGVTNADGSPVSKREGVMLTFVCPKCGPDGARHGHVACYLNPAMDGAPYKRGSPCWNRTGDTFETLTLSPSILVKPDNGRGCGWHGFVENGEVVDEHHKPIPRQPWQDAISIADLEAMEE